ncbi:hypothetical protein MTO96_011022 [Rhipicephalus appendiculatus]
MAGLIAGTALSHNCRCSARLRKKAASSARRCEAKQNPFGERATCCPRHMQTPRCRAALRKAPGAPKRPFSSAESRWRSGTARPCYPTPRVLSELGRFIPKAAVTVSARYSLQCMRTQNFPPIVTHALPLLVEKCAAATSSAHRCPKADDARPGDEDYSAQENRALLSALSTC